jgi:hypothetical protein
MHRPALWALSMSLIALPAAADDFSLDLDASATFYGDNTEFSNPFRTGETLTGAWAAVFVEGRVSDRLALRGGVFGHQRFGSDSAFDEVRPVIALVIGSRSSRLVLGTLETHRRSGGGGPDRAGPHGLLPPFQRETLAFDRPWEAGVQWLVDTPRVSQDAWVHWQRVARPGQRERFDAGVTSRVRLRRALALRGDAHLVHQGGQVRAAEPVADSVAAGVGVEAAAGVGRLDRLSLEAVAVVSRHAPDRARAEDARTGFGTFIRGAVEEHGWRLHAILWRSDDFIKAEGDAHYQSVLRDGSRYRGLRDYAEAGVTRTFDLGPGSWLEASVRWHRVERDYEYSFRVLAVGRLRARLKG